MKLDRVIAVRNTKTVYRDGDLCLKVFGPSFSKADVLNEATNHARIEATGLTVPKLLEVTSIDGKWAIVMEYIKGKTLAQMMEEDSSQREAHLNLFVDLQLDVLSRTCPSLERQKDELTRKIIVTELDATTRYNLHSRLENMPRQNKVCHGDFNPTNIIVSTDGTPYVLDWGHVTQGNPAADASRSCLLFWLNYTREEADQYLDLFCEKSGIDKTTVRSWSPLVAAAQSVEGNKKHREFLLSWVEAVNHK